MERRAAEAEREILQWKKVRFMADKVGDVFDGYITGVAPFGLFVELIEHYVEGLVHVSTMADDYYRFREQAHALFGENTKKTYRLGDQVRVQIVRVDMERRQIDLGLEDVLETVRRDERRRGPRAQSRAAEEGAAQRHAGAAPQEQSGEPARKQRPGRRERADEEAMTSHRRRHRRPHRSRQEHAGAGADRHRSRSPQGRKGARHHHRARALRTPTDRRHARRVCRRARPRALRATMLAGVGGIDCVLLIVAADESVMPQTREHFDICRLLRIPRGIVVLTKSDLADADTRELVRQDVRELVKGSFLETAPVVAGVGDDRRGARRAARTPSSTQVGAGATAAG